MNRIYLVVFGQICFYSCFNFLGSRLCFRGILKARTDPRSLCPITWSSSSPRKRLFPPTPSQRPSSKSQTPSRPFKQHLSIYLLSILKLFQNKNAEKKILCLFFRSYLYNCDMRHVCYSDLDCKYLTRHNVYHTKMFLVLKK